MRLSTPFLFAGTLLAAVGYGATFLLSAYYRGLGGSDLDVGTTLGAAMAGTCVGVPMVGWLSGRLGAARMAAVACILLGCGFLLLAGVSQRSLAASVAAGALIGCGWGVFYLGAPMALSERVTDADRAFWFTRFGAFQMAGIGGGPLMLDLSGSVGHLSVTATFRLVAATCVVAGALLWMFDRLAPSVPPSSARRAWVRPIGAIARTPALYPILMVALGACVFSGLLTFQSTLVAGTPARPTTFYAVYTATVVLARLVLGHRLAAWPQRRLAAVLLISMTFGVAAMAGVGLSAVFQIASALLTGLGYGLVYTVIQSWAVNEAPVQYRHAALTWFVLSYFVGVFGFPVMGGWLLVHFGRDGLLLALLAAALAELALLLVIASGSDRLGTDAGSASNRKDLRPTSSAAEAPAKAVTTMATP